MEEFSDTEQKELLIEGDDSLHTILLVEDNEELLQILNSLFSPTYRVLLARNGKEGLEKARAERPDIIVSDVMMPEMSGTEMCLKIKNDFDVCHIPVVLLTALTSAEQNIEGLQRGADDYINKPFNAKVLLARCNNLVRNRIILQKKFSQQKMLSLDVMRAVMSEEKKTDLERVTLKNETLRRYFPKSYTPKQMEQTIIRLLDVWQKQRQKNQER